MSRSKLADRINAKDPPPFWEMDDEMFEELCADLIAREPGISHCDRFGRKRQPQYGIDLVAARSDGSGTDVAQCKCHKSFSATRIRDASNEFLKHWNYWQRRNVRRFVLIVACDLSDRRCQEAIDEQISKFRDYDLIYERSWSNRTLRQKLSLHRDIAACYLPDYWVEKICGRARPQYVTEGVAPAGTAMAMATITEIGSSHLTQQLSENMREKLGATRDLVRSGRIGEARRSLEKLQTTKETWRVLEPPVQALALRLQTVIALNKGDVATARSLVSQAEHLTVGEDLAALKALIVYHEEGSTAALDNLAGATGTSISQLRADLLVESGQFQEALEALETATTGREDPDILRIRSLALLGLGERDSALAAAERALVLQPGWVSTRLTFATVTYFASLSPGAFSGHPLAWPQPVPWMLVLRDDASLDRRRRAGQQAQLVLEQADLPREFRREVEALRLACLACDSERRDEAEQLCQDLIHRDRLHIPAIAWGLGRGFPIDLTKTMKNLEQFLIQGRADLNQTIALVACHVRDGRAERAAKLLHRARARFAAEDRLDLWLLIHAQLPPGTISGAGIGEDREAEETKVRTMDPLASLLPRVLQAGHQQDWQAIGNLASEAVEKGHLVAFAAACETLALKGQWELLLPQTEALISAIGTADAARMAALAMFHGERYKDCLDLLGRVRSLFPQGVLSSDLRRVQIRSNQALGRLPDAISLAEQAALEEPSSEAWIDLVDLTWMKGDLPATAYHARRLGSMPDVPPEALLRTAARIAPADTALGRDLFRRALQREIPDHLLANAVEVGWRLGAPEEVGPLMTRLTETASSDRDAAVRMLTNDEFREFLREAAEEQERLEDVYARGSIHVHYVIERLNLSLAQLLSPLRSVGTESHRELDHPPIHLRYGGRPTPTLSDLPLRPEAWRLHLDTTALLVADALGMLPVIEEAFKPLWIPQHLQPALMRIEQLEAGYRGDDSRDECERRERIDWVQRLRQHLSHGIDDGTYCVLPDSPMLRSWLRSPGHARLPEHLSFMELLGVEPAPNNFIWIDDRWVTSHLHAPGATIVSTTDLLVALETYGVISQEARCEKLQRLRAANSRYIPLSVEEIVQHLRSAAVEQGKVMESPQLRVLRRYFANCFLDAEFLQRPPVPEFIRNPHGEMRFSLSLNRAVHEALAQTFQDEAATQEERWARAEWIWESLRIQELPGVFHPDRSPDDRLTWLGQEVGGLLARAVLLSWKESPEPDTRGQEFLDWIELRILRPSLRSSPGLAGQIVRCLKDSLLSFDNSPKSQEIPVESVRYLKSRLVEMMPEPVNSHLLRDQEILESLGDFVQSIVGSGELLFRSKELWPAVEDAIHGQGAEVRSADGDRRFAVHKGDENDDSQAVYLEVRPARIRIRIEETLVKLVSDDVDHRRAALLDHADWFDQAEAERAAHIEQIVREPEVSVRVDRLLAIRKTSAAYYYSELRRAVRRPADEDHQEVSIPTSELLPPSVESLLSYHRLDRELAVSDFPSALGNGARQLMGDEGVEETLRRLAGLPAPIPECVLEALAGFEPRDREEVLSRALGGRGSPMSAIHLVRCRLYFKGSEFLGDAATLRLAEPLTRPSRNQTGLAFLEPVAR